MTLHVRPIRPPAHVEPFVRVLGQALAVEFLMAFGGTEVHWATDPKGRSKMAGMIGVERARALADLDLPRRVPNAKPWLVHVLRAEGLSVPEIAVRLHVTDVTVRRMLVKDPGGSSRDQARGPEDRQLRLL
jgi:hypothetical protein